MSITDELRAYAGNFYLFRYKDVREKLDAIADRIDAEYQKAIRELNNLADASVLLPVDADGVPWHIGDRTESGQTIQAMGLNRHGWHFVGTVNEIDPSIHHHYHATTVEDVLREFASVGIHIAAKHGIEAGEFDFYADEEAIAEYAAKLQLTESDDQ